MVLIVGTVIGMLIAINSISKTGGEVLAETTHPLVMFAVAGVAMAMEAMLIALIVAVLSLMDLWLDTLFFLRAKSDTEKGRDFHTVMCCLSVFNLAMLPVCLYAPLFGVLYIGTMILFIAMRLIYGIVYIVRWCRLKKAE